MRLRPIERRDLDRIRELRNANREWFFDDAEISREQHERWFDGLSEHPVAFYVIEVEGAVVGTVSVTDTPDGREIGNLVLDSGHRGRGLMTQAVAQLTRDPGRYFAEVRPDNQASLGVFERVGFNAKRVRVERVVGS